MADRTNEAFTSGDEWTPVSSKLTTARRLLLGLAYLLVIAGVVALFVIGRVPEFVAWTGLAVALVGFIWLWWLIGRRVRSFGYSERGDDLLVTSGIMFRRLVIVPYGRMQLVGVKAGPVDRWMGLTTVQLHTAAATTDAAIPGLEPQIAADLRDRLARRGEQRDLRTVTMPEPEPSRSPLPSAVDDLGLGLTIPGRGSVDEAGRRQVHPISPLVHGVGALPIGFVIVFAMSAGAAPGWGLSAGAVIVLLLIALPLVVGAWSYVGWQNLWFWFDEDGDFRVGSGVLTKQQRRLRLSRLQSVDVAQPLVARLFSMAELTVEVAGTAGLPGEAAVPSARRCSRPAERAAGASRRTTARRGRGARGARGHRGPTRPRRLTPAAHDDRLPAPADRCDRRRDRLEQRVGWARPGPVHRWPARAHGRRRVHQVLQLHRESVT